MVLGEVFLSWNTETLVDSAKISGPVEWWLCPEAEKENGGCGCWRVSVLRGG